MRLQAMVAPPEAIGQVTEGGNIVGNVTLGGTIDLLLFAGVGFGAFGAVTLVALWPWLSEWSTRLRPLGLGLFVLAVGGADVIEPDNGDFPAVGNEWFSVVLFASLFILWGYVAVWLRGFLDGRLPAGGRPWTIGYTVLVVIGAPLYVGLPSTLLDDISNTPTAVAIAVFVLFLAAVGTWVPRLWPDTARIDPSARAIGYAAIAVALTVGLVRVATDAIRIIG